MVAFIVLNLREGDMVSILGAYPTRQQANQRMLDAMEQHDSSTSWWKIVEYGAPDPNPGYYDVVVRVSWGSSNRVRVIGMFQHGSIPQGMYEGERYFTESVNF